MAAETKGSAALGWVVLIIAFVVVMAALHGEHEGTVKYDDCREVIVLSPDTLQTFYKSFTCTYVKTNKGHIMSGVCVSVEEPWFGPGCTKAYIYYKKPFADCGQHASLTYDEMCACDAGFVRDSKDPQRQCVALGR